MSHDYRDRLNWLASDRNPDADSRAGYRDLLTRMASGAELPAGPASSQIPVDYTPVVTRLRSCCG